MADITKCNNEDCGLKETCKRYNAQSGEIQSVQRFEPNKLGCNFYLQDKKKKIEKQVAIKAI